MRDLFFLLIFVVLYEIIRSAEFEKILRFTNVKCETYDKAFAEFSVCKLSVPSRNKITMSMHVVLHQVPVNNVTLNFALLKKESGYRPFMYNITVDFCQFMANKRRNPFLKIVFDSTMKSSNINHTCPYNHDIIINQMLLDEEMFRLIPLPKGEYLYYLRVGAYNEWKANVFVYLTKSDSF